MELKEVLQQVLQLYRMTAYELCKKLGVTFATMSRALNNKTDVGYNEVNSWLNRLGVEIINEKVVYRYEKINIKILDILNNSTSKNEDKYISLINQLQQIAEKSKKYHQIYLLPDPKEVHDPKWRALYAGWLTFTNYLIYHVRKHYPCDLSKKWAPVKWHNVHSKYNPIMLRYNVVVPEDELRWI